MKHYSKMVIFVSIICMLASCGKEYTCSHNVHYYPPSIIFKGFSGNDLKHVVVNTYDAGTLFENKLSSDTFDYSAAVFAGDTAYVADGNAARGFYQLKVGRDYEFVVLAANQNFKISNVREGDPVKTWTQKDACSPGASQLENSPCSADMNNLPVTVIYGFGGYSICLAH